MAKSINLKDSTDNIPIHGISQEQYESLKQISGKSISDLCSEKENGHLLIYPDSIGACEDDPKNLKILTLKSELSTDEDTTVKADRLFGIVSIDDLEINIHSRFDNNDNDYFFYYMLCRVYSINVFDMEHKSGKEKALDILFLIFRHLLNEALQQGVYKEYVKKEYNDSQIKGVLDVSRHIKLNNPFQGRIAYHTREFNYDNHLTQLIRHTIEFMERDNLGQALLERDKTTKNHVSLIRQMTPSYSSVQLKNVMGKNIRPIQNPFFSKYIPLQIICMQILRHEKISYGSQPKQVSGILIDSAWLWEEYINTVIKPLGLIHAENKKRNNGFNLTQNNYTRYPDFYQKKEYGVVFDAKYKMKDKKHEGSDRDDVNQMVTYMYRLKALAGYFILPSTEDKESTNNELLGYGKDRHSVIGTMYLNIPQKPSSFETFVDDIQGNEKRDIIEVSKQIIEKT